MLKYEKRLNHFFGKPRSLGRRRGVKIHASRLNCGDDFRNVHYGTIWCGLSKDCLSVLAEGTPTHRPREVDSTGSCSGLQCINRHIYRAQAASTFACAHASQQVDKTLLGRCHRMHELNKVSVVRSLSGHMPDVAKVVNDSTTGPCYKPELADVFNVEASKVPNTVVLNVTAVAPVVSCVVLQSLPMT